MEALGILWGNLIWQALAFGVLVWLLSKYAYQPVIRVLDERANRIRESMEQAEQIKADNADAAQRAQQLIAEAQAQTASPPNTPKAPAGRGLRGSANRSIRPQAR